MALAMLIAERVATEETVGKVKILRQIMLMAELEVMEELEVLEVMEVQSQVNPVSPVPLEVTGATGATAHPAAMVVMVLTGKQVNASGPPFNTGGTTPLGK